MAKKREKITDNPKLRTKKLSDGNLRYYLEYYYGYTIGSNGNPKPIRKKEFLKLTIPEKPPRNPLEKRDYEETIEQAHRIRREREIEFLEDKEGYKFKREKKINFLQFFEEYIANYTKADKRVILSAYNRFKDFLRLTDEYSRFTNYIEPKQITSSMIWDFVDYLVSISNGTGAQTTFKRFKKVIKYATTKGVFDKNPCDEILVKTDNLILRKNVLSVEEIGQLLRTPTDTNPEIKKAFVFSLYMGLRYCDIKVLRFENIDFANKQLLFNQRKTGKRVTLPISDYILELIGKPKASNKELIFEGLPTNEGCNKALKKWVEQAGIMKHITWHCARHSFATNILKSGANIKTTQELLGHASLRYTEVYVRAIDEAKTRAINSLPTFNIKNYE